jgi:hypothetical protein
MTAGRLTWDLTGFKGLGEGPSDGGAVGRVEIVEEWVFGKTELADVG